MNLQQIDVRRVQPLQARLDLVEQCLPGQAGLVHVLLLVAQLRLGEGAHADVVSDESVGFGEDGDAVARNVELRVEDLVSIRSCHRMRKRSCSRPAVWPVGREERGRMEKPTCLIAFPMIFSDSPFEYTFAVSQVVTPFSHAALSSGRA
jgi:hypothetical protein